MSEAVRAKMQAKFDRAVLARAGLGGAPRRNRRGASSWAGVRVCPAAATRRRKRFGGDWKVRQSYPLDGVCRFGQFARPQRLRTGLEGSYGSSAKFSAAALWPAQGSSPHPIARQRKRAPSAVLSRVYWPGMQRAWCGRRQSLGAAKVRPAPPSQQQVCE